ncbi:MAG: ABC transporter G family ATP-binding protein/permease [Opitutales bacterium]|jgi:ABC transport system ATP-binding/permease protein|nr:ABC transporter G family ATP-binding protein/permease [Opitutales bacterium]
MLSCKELSVEIGPQKVRILDRATAQFKGNALNAVIGPSGCGKTTLVKAMLGILPGEGEVYYDGEAIHDSADFQGKLSFAPQFSIAHELLKVEEALRYALDLCVVDTTIKAERLEEILRRTGLTEHREKRVDSLSGGQLRRLGLGLELVGDPQTMVCDEVTSGLDPRSEDQILTVLQRLRDDRAKSFICIIHNLAKLEFFDWITVVYEGDVVFQGTLDALNAYFNIPDALHLYDRLNEQPIDVWRQRWSESKQTAESAEEVPPPEPAAAPKLLARPSALSQTLTLLRRKAVLFKRDRGYWLLTLGITLGFPLLVTIFAMDGLPQLRGMAMNSAGGFLEQMQDNLRFRIDALETASLVTGLILFQVILLTLMGSNNGAREIAGERDLYEKERFAGLNPHAYATSKLLFTSAIALGQGVWMTLFVKLICEFPGPWMPQTLILILSCVSMTAVCLGFSAIFGSADKASLLSVYLVGFQLPLSGIVLALPDALVWICRPFINAYWGWAGYFSSMIETRFYDAYRLETTEAVPSPTMAVIVLLLHFMVGAAMVFWGCQRKRWV